MWPLGLLYLNEGEHPSPRGDNSKRIKIPEIFKISRTSRTILIKLGTNYLWVKGIQVLFLNNGLSPLQSGDNHKNVKMGWGDRCGSGICRVAK
jgi:hypothetical protein